MASGSSGFDRGYAGLDLDRALAEPGTGLHLAAQWFVLDPVTGAFAATPRLEFHLAP